MEQPAVEQSDIEQTTTHQMTTGMEDFQPAVACSSAGCERPFVGVNLGGWLILEDWMWPSEMKDKGLADEWSFVKAHGGPQDPKAIKKMKEHWETFVTSDDLDKLKDWGVTHVRVPVGWWLIDYDPTDGFVQGGERYLFRLLGWLRQRDMKALIDLHALPGAQAVHQSFTGKRSKVANFFLDKEFFDRGKQAMVKLARSIVTYESNILTSGVVIGMELGNEHTWQYWGTSPGIRELYESMVPELRRILPASRYALFLSFQESPRVEGVRWLASMRAKDPANFSGVVYDAHMYHSYGDDNVPGKSWDVDEDSCKTCCRDAQVLKPLAEAKLPFIIGEWSLNTGFPGNPGFWHTFMRNQLSLWNTARGSLGSFFWNHRILHRSNDNGRFQEMSLLDLIRPRGPIPPVKVMETSELCPGKDLDKCPAFNPQVVKFNDQCTWKE
jgi:aryl-phospho-beta-D-glucosidase BglC (GH1 family)